MLRKARFFLMDASTEDDIFNGYTSVVPEFWNGWSCPYFTKKEAFRIVNWWNSQLHLSETQAWYNEKTDEFCFPVYHDETELDIFKGQIHDKLGTLYPIGNRCWTWVED